MKILCSVNTVVRSVTPFLNYKYDVVSFNNSVN